MFGDLFGKLQEMQERVAEAKERLETVSVSGESPDGRVKIVADGNQKIKAVEIADDLRQGDPEELEDLLILSINKALERSKNVHNTALTEATGDMLPPHLMNLMNTTR